MPSHTRQNGSRNTSAPSRANSVTSDAPTSSSRTMQALPLPDVRPSPAYVAASAAAELATDYQRDRMQDDYAGDDGSFAEPDSALFTDPALATINAFLDQLLFSFLSTARASTLAALRPAVDQVLKGKLARQAIESAEEELEELLGGGDDEDEIAADEDDDDVTPPKWDTIAVWKRTRLRIMVYTRLGEMEDEDEDNYLEDDGLDVDGHDLDRASASASLVSWSAAIFLTSVLEFIAEQCLAIAAQAAYDRAECPKTSRPSTRDGDEERVLIAEHHVERVALNSSLGRLWRTWRKSLRAGRRSGLVSASSSRRPSLSGNLLATPSAPDAGFRSHAGNASKSSSRDLRATPASMPETPGQSEYTRRLLDEHGNESTAHQSTIKRVQSLLSFPETSSSTPVTPAPEEHLPVRFSRSYSVPGSEPPPIDLFLKRLAESKAYIEAKVAAQAGSSAIIDDTPTVIKKQAADRDEWEDENGDIDNEKHHRKNAEQPIIQGNTSNTASRTTLDVDRGLGTNLRAESAESLREAIIMEPEVAQTVRVTSKPAAPTKVNVVNRQRSPPRASQNQGSGKYTDYPERVESRFDQSSNTVRETFFDSQPPQNDELEGKSRVTKLDRTDKSMASDGLEDGSISAAGSPRDESQETNGGTILGRGTDPTLRSLNDSTSTNVTDNGAPSSRSAKKRPAAIKVEQGEIDTSLFPPTPRHIPGSVPAKQYDDESNYQDQSSTSAVVETSASPQSDERRRSSESSKYSTAAGSLKTSVSGKTSKKSPVLPNATTSGENQVQVDTRERDFDNLINAEETLKYTLTPKNLRTFEQTNGTGSKQLMPTMAKMEQPQPERSSPKDHSNQRNRSPHSGSTWSDAPEYGTAVISNAPRKPLRIKHFTSRPPPTNAPRSHNGLVAREPRIQTESTRDFADFIRSTAPDGRTITTQPVLSSTNTPLRSAFVSPRISRRNSRELKPSDKVVEPPVPNVASAPKPKVAQKRFEPRDAVVSDRVNQDLINFFKDGPGSSGASVSRKPLQDDAVSKYLRSTNSNSALRSNRESSTTSQSAQDSVNSHTGLLPGNKPNGLRSGPSEASLYNQQPTASPNAAPIKKQRRVRDPYAIDFDDDDEAVDIVTSLPPKQETLMDFLSTYEPTAPQASPAVRGAGTSGEVKGAGVKGFLKKMSSAA